MTIDELIKKYPDGFVVTASGSICKVLFATSYFVKIANVYPLAPPGGGYFVAEMTEDFVEVEL